MDKSVILNKIKKHLDIKTDAEFANFLGINASTLSMWRTNNSINKDLLLEKIENLNANWLLTGKGEMLKDTPAKEVGFEEMYKKVVALLEENNNYLKELREKDVEINALQSQLNEYKEQLKEYANMAKKVDTSANATFSHTNGYSYTPPSQQ